MENIKTLAEKKTMKVALKNSFKEYIYEKNSKAGVLARKLKSYYSKEDDIFTVNKEGKKYILEFYQEVKINITESLLYLFFDVHPKLKVNDLCKYIGTYPRKEFKEHERFLYLGEINRMSGHGIFVNSKGVVLRGYHIEEFEPLSNEEI